MRKYLFVVAVLIGGASVGRGQNLDPAEMMFFEAKIRPVLVEKCYSCHSAEAEKAKKLRGGLRLDTRQGLLAGGDSGPAIVGGKPEMGTLLPALRHAGDVRMPPAGKLSDAVVADFVTWIKNGAVDPRDGTTPATVTLDVEKARREHWAFRLPVKGPLPEVRQGAWPLGAIDRFVLARMEGEDLRPASPAGKNELLRRVTFGLHGLPPTPEEMAAFLADESPNAWERVIERLLAAPQYGERWGRHWLDVARYAEDRALATAQDSPHAYRYRDWVVQALNRDLPYDQFLRLQLAGDLIKEPADEHFLRLGGLGFQGLGQLYHRGNFAEQVMADELDDRVDTVSRGLLGLTVACARCHDHKYDPIPTRDYYSLAAAYQGSNLSTLPLASPEDVQRHARFTEEMRQREATLNQWLADRARQVSSDQLGRLREYLQTAWQIRDRKMKQMPVDVATLAGEKKLVPYFLTRFVRMVEDTAPASAEEPLRAWRKLAQAEKLWSESLEKATAELAQQASALAVEQQKIEEAYRREVARAAPEKQPAVKRGELPAGVQSIAKALVQKDPAPLFLAGKDVVPLLGDTAKKDHQDRVAELNTFRQSGPPAPPLVHAVSGGGQAMKVHIRGNVERKGEEAPPGFLRVLRAEGALSAAKTFTRLDLAEAIVSRDNPLTARVIVNRVWAHHFGRGLVATPSNFGKLGETPTHPELLDWLAVSFVENGSSLKWLHRQILRSRVYQLASERIAEEQRDPENLYLSRWTPRRLDFEAWRDAVLSVSGRLDLTQGGPSQPVDASTRRTVYAKISRSRLDPTLAVFDFPDANVSSEKRSVTTVAQQQLFVLNSGFMIDAGKALASRVAHLPDDAERIRQVYRLAFGREASTAEVTLGVRFLQGAGTDQKLTPWQRYAQAILAANEFTWVP